MSFLVRRTKCATCIYRTDHKLKWNLAQLEEQVRDPHLGFNGFRICHHHTEKSNVCCRGFWNAHKDEFAAGQIAQRLDLVEFTDEIGLDHDQERMLRGGQE